MARHFKTADYAATLQQTITIGDCLAPNHLARCIVTVIALLDSAMKNTRFFAQHPPVG